MVGMIHAEGCTEQGQHTGPCPRPDTPPHPATQSVNLPTPEMVDHPAHYGGEDNPYETIKVLEAWLSPEQMTGFLLGNAIKYLSRAGKKDALAQDLKKATWYTERYILHIEKATSA